MRLTAGRLARLNSLEAFWESIKNGTAVNGENGFTIPDVQNLADFAASTTPINVTGYSLGANLAQAFTELHDSVVGNTYFFNGIGTGIAQGGFSAVWTVYKAVFDDPRIVSLPPSNDPESLSMEEEWYNQFISEPNAVYDSLYDNPRHKLAMYAIQALVQGAASVSDYIGNPYTAEREPMANTVDIWASNYEGDSGWDSIVSRGGIRHGISRRIFYEDQPLISEIPSPFSLDWFGYGHSLALLQDSLNLMAAFEILAPDVTEDMLGCSVPGRFQQGLRVSGENSRCAWPGFWNHHESTSCKRRTMTLPTLICEMSFTRNSMKSSTLSLSRIYQYVDVTRSDRVQR